MIDLKNDKIEIKNTDHDHSNKNIATNEFNNLITINLAARLNQKI